MEREVHSDKSRFIIVTDHTVQERDIPITMRSNQIDQILNFQYLPDLIFSTNTKFANAFPDDAGLGKLDFMFPQRPLIPFANLAHCAMIIDDYIVQFSGNGNLYMMNIVNGKVLGKRCCDFITTEFCDWIIKAGNTGAKLLSIFDENQTAMQYLQVYTMLLSYHTTNYVSKQNYLLALQWLRTRFGLSPDSEYLNIYNGAWFYGREKKTWGNIALSIFKEYFNIDTVHL